MLENKSIVMDNIGALETQINKLERTVMVTITVETKKRMTTVEDINTRFHQIYKTLRILKEMFSK